MRLFIKILVLICLFPTSSFGQNYCYCNKYKDLEFDCTKTTLTNGANVYWSLNCDSSWLTFENRNRKVVLYSFDSTSIDMTQKIGIDFETHYPGLILLRNKLISGCCTPSEFILLNDDTADTVKDLGRILYHSIDIRNPFILKFRFQDYDHYENNDGFDFTLEIFDITTRKSKYFTKYSKQLKNYYLMSGMTYPEELFNDISIESNKLIVHIRHKINHEWKTSKIILPK